MRVVNSAAEAADALAQRAERGAQGLRPRRVLHRALSHLASPHRDAGLLRHQGQRHLARRARLLGPAPPPEAGRGISRGELPRRRPHRHGRSGGRGCARVRLRQRRHRRVPVPGRRVLLPRDEHAAPGRAPRHRAHDGPRPRRAAAARRSGQEAALLPEPDQLEAQGSRRRDRSAHQRRRPGRRQVPPVARHPDQVHSSRRFRRARRRRLRRGRHRQPVLRQPRRQADRVGRRPRGGPAPHAARHRGDGDRRHRDHHAGARRDPAPRRLHQR